jgi:tRNA G10  N-methylase Trm11
MINLAEMAQEAAIYDPFCGSGTVLQEALLLGYTDISGSDINERNIADTKQNLDWLSTSSVLTDNPTRLRASQIAQSDDRIFVADVLETGGLKLEATCNAIVGEGFLGEPYRRSGDQATKDAEQLTEFYLQALTNLAKQLTPNGRIVLAIPFFIAESEYFYLPILEKLEQTGLTIVKPNLGSAEIKLPGRGNLTYSRPDQFVGREILLLNKTS